MKTTLFFLSLGTDEYGETIHNSMYRHLWTIGPKEAIESMDYSFKDHFGKDLPSFVPRDIIRLYLEGIFHHRIYLFNSYTY